MMRMVTERSVQWWILEHNRITLRQAYTAPCTYVCLREILTEYLS
jgi:hypothetical protein